MGLDISCRCGEIGFRAGSYSGFNAFREILAKLCDIDLHEFWMKNPISKRNGEERFYELLNHSDCDGVLPYRECKRLLEDFEWLERKLRTPQSPEDVWNKLFDNFDVPDWWMKSFSKWHEAVRHVVNSKCKLIFC